MNAIENSTKPICGIFKRSQLSERFIKYAAATFIATTSISLQANGQSDIKLDSLEQACEYLDEHEHTDEFFGMIVEVQAEPIGGYKKFFEAIGAEIEFPRGLTEPGKVYLQFEVDTLGSMSNLTVVKTFNDLAGQEAIRTLQKLDYHFNPAEQRGKKVKSKMIIPITFDLDN